MKDERLHSILTYCIAAVWLINGFLWKVLNLIPRHEQIVSRILQTDHTRFFTLLIGFAEIIMGCWILSQWRSRLCTILQIVTVASMNLLEFFITPDLLLWGRANSIVALVFIALLYFHEFVLGEKQLVQP